MKTLLITLILLCTTGAFAQGCKPYRTIKDDFIDQKVSYYGAKIGTERSMFLGVTVTSYVLVTKQDSNQFTLIYNMQYYQKEGDASVNNIKYPTGTSFDLRTAEGIKTYTSENVRNKKMLISGKTLTVCELSLSVGKSEIEYLSKNKLLAYRITPPEGSTTQGKVDERSALKLQNQMSCILGIKPDTPEEGSTQPKQPRIHDEGEKGRLASNSKNIAFYMDLGFGPITGYTYGPYFSIDLKIGNKFYFNSNDSKTRFGLDVNWLSLNPHFVWFDELPPGNLSVAKPGFTVAYSINDKAGIDFAINLGPNFHFSNGFNAAGLNINPHIKFQIANFCVGIEHQAQIHITDDFTTNLIAFTAGFKL